MKIIAEKRGHISRILVETPPRKRVVTLLAQHANLVSKFNLKSIKASYFLSIPRMLYGISCVNPVKGIFGFDDLYIAIPPDDYTDESHLYIPPFHNVSPCGNTCLGYDILKRNYDSPINLAKNVIDVFWGTLFKVGIMSATHSYEGKLLHSHTAWEQLTYNDPNWIPGPDDLVRMKRSSGPGDYTNFGNWKTDLGH